MKILSIALFLLIGYSGVLAQSGKLFEIEHKTMHTHFDENIKKQFKTRYQSFFEDENYIVRKSCAGEWGGSIIFKNKKTQIDYACMAVCPVAINKIDGKYIVSNTLAHMSGSSNIIKIDNPDSMDVFVLPEIDKRYIRSRESQSHSTKGSKLVVDTFHLLILASFQYQGQLYHITTDLEKTYVSKIENSRFVNLELIANEVIWTLSEDRILTVDDHYISFFSNEDGTKGYLDIAGNKISVIKFWR